VPALSRRLVAEGVGTALLLAAIVGSGIMAERLSAGNLAIALLCNSLATGAMLYVLITILAPISGAHLNPAVTLSFLLKGSIGTVIALAYIACQFVGAPYWFTASTSFANPAVTVARSLTDTFSGIQPSGAPGFILAQLAGAVVASLFCRWLFRTAALTQTNEDLRPMLRRADA
jgi:glycerol uptake facilitator-like aquaporin